MIYLYTAPQSCVYKTIHPLRQVCVRWATSFFHLSCTPTWCQSRPPLWLESISMVIINQGALSGYHDNLQISGLRLLGCVWVWEHRLHLLSGVWCGDYPHDIQRSEDNIPDYTIQYTCTCPGSLSYTQRHLLVILIQRYLLVILILYAANEIKEPLSIQQ